MICPNCGADLSDDLNFCIQCGSPLKQTDVVSENVEAEAYTPEAVINEAYVPEEAYTPEINDEVYVPQVAPEYAYNTDYAPEFDQTAYAPPLPQNDPGKGLGIASMVVGIVGLLCCGIIIFPSPVALILGIVARSNSKKAGFNNGFATAGIATGAVGTALFIVLPLILSLLYLIFGVIIFGGTLGLGVLSGM